MELTYKEVMDYIRCPQLYKFKYVLKLDRRDPEIDLYKSALKSVVMYFYYNAMNGNTPTLEAMMSRWHRTWNKDKPSIEDILFKNNQAKTLKNYNIDGLKSLEKFYNTQMTQEFTPIVVNTEVRLPFGNHFYTDTLDVVRELKIENKSIIEVIRLSNAINKWFEFQINHDFRMTFQVKAFRTLFEVSEDRAVLYNIKRAQQEFTRINESDFNMLDSVIVNVGDSISEGRFYPIVAQQCTYCPYVDVCNKYKF